MYQSTQAMILSYQNTHKDSATVMNLIDANLARCAYSNTSKYPSHHAALARIEFSELLLQARADINDALSMARQDEESYSQTVQQWFDATARDMAKSYCRYLRAQAQCMDVRITGAQRYEVSKAYWYQQNADAAWRSMINELVEKKRTLLRALLCDEYLITNYSEQRAVLQLH